MTGGRKRCLRDTAVKIQSASELLGRLEGTANDRKQRTDNSQTEVVSTSIALRELDFKFKSGTQATQQRFIFKRIIKCRRG